MSARTFVIDDPTAQALRNATYSGQSVEFPDPLGPDVWATTKAALIRMGAEHARNTSRFDFDPDQDARSVVTATLKTGQIMGAKGAAGWVPTPQDLARHIVGQYMEHSYNSRDRVRVLEPSAGRGALVDAITRGGRDVDWLDVTAVELDARRAAYIDFEGVTVVVDTFEAFADAAESDGQLFDVVMMNPPYSVPGKADIWALHVLLAWRLLTPGGCLVAIVPASAAPDGRTGGNVKGVREVRDLVRTYGEVRDLVRTYGRVAEDLEDDAFAESGVTVSTCVIVLHKPLKTEPVRVAPFDGPQYLTRIYSGSEPVVNVAHPVFTRAAAECMPVQRVRDTWRNAHRIMRYRGECVTCGTTTWAFDDGENDPRGMLGDHAYDGHDAEEFDMVGQSIAQCFGCANDSRQYDKMRAIADGAHWTSAPMPAGSAPVPVSPAGFACQWNGTDGRRCDGDPLAVEYQSDRKWLAGEACHRHLAGAAAELVAAGYEVRLPVDVHMANGVTSGPQCVAYANRHDAPEHGQPCTFVDGDVTCPACLAAGAEPVPVAAAPESADPWADLVVCTLF